MKHKPLTCIIILSIFSCTAQRKMSVEQYDKTRNFGKGSIIVENNFYDRFVGTWVWQQEEKKLIIKFSIKDISFPNADAKVTLKQLEGKCEYLVSGKKLVLDPKKSKIYGLSLNNSDRVVLEIDNDFKRFASTTKIELIFVSKNSLRFQYVGEVSDAHKQKIPFPVDVTLTRGQ